MIEKMVKTLFISMITVEILLISNRLTIAATIYHSNSTMRKVLILLLSIISISMVDQARTDVAPLWVKILSIIMAIIYGGIAILIMKGRVRRNTSDVVQHGFWSLFLVEKITKSDK
jgi:hypothetical protein